VLWYRKQLFFPRSCPHGERGADEHHSTGCIVLRLDLLLHENRERGCSVHVRAVDRRSVRDASHQQTAVGAVIGGPAECGEDRPLEKLAANLADHPDVPGPFLVFL